MGYATDKNEIFVREMLDLMNKASPRQLGSKYTPCHSLALVKHNVRLLILQSI
jgi:hypothetical protein